MNTAKQLHVSPMRNYILEDYLSYLEDKKAGSVSTYKNYRGDLKQFFSIKFGKDEEHVTIEDLEGVTGNDVVDYRNDIRKKYSSVATVNRKINAIKSFFKFMEADHPSIRSAIFNKTKNIKNPKKKGWGILTYEEVVDMIELSKGFENGCELSILIELAFKTGIRLEALLSMKWGDIYQRHQHGVDVYTIEVVDKGEQHIKAIADNVYDRLSELRWTNKDEESVFKNFHPHKVGKAISDLCNMMSIDPRRKIKFHSLKKAGINFVYDATGDIMMAQKQGNHKSATTTMESYMKHKEDLTAMPSYTMGDSIDLSPLESLSKVELMQLIEKASATCQLELLRKI